MNEVFCIKCLTTDIGGYNYCLACHKKLMNQDRLAIMMQKQKELFLELHNQKDFSKLSSEEKQALFNKFILAIHEETTELLKTTNYKQHDIKKLEFKRSNAIIEVVDVLKYLMNIMVLLEITPEELFKYEQEKSNFVLQKYEQQFTNFENENVLYVDIDGVLADYPQSFYNFVNQKLGTNYDPTKQNNYDFCKVFNIDRTKYEELKFEYRESGYKRDIPTIDGAEKYMQLFHLENYKIIIFTARPAEEYNRIYLDTIYWLNKNGIRYDKILFAEKKHEELAKYYKKINPVCFIEDNEDNASFLSNDGIKVVLFNKPYHKMKSMNENVVRVNDWNEAYEQVKRWTN